MEWVIAILLLVVIGIGFKLSQQLEWIAELSRASGQANVRNLAEVATKLEAIQMHVERVAKPFLEAEEQRRKFEMDDPF